MAITLDEYVKAIEATERNYAPASLVPVLKHLATDMCELRRQVAQVSDDGGAHEERLDAHDARHDRLTKDVRRLEDFAGFGTVMGRTLPHPLPQWISCTVTRAANAVIVTEGYSQVNMGGRALSFADVYVFDDFETAGRFVAAVLTQEKPWQAKGNVPLHKDRP